MVPALTQPAVDEIQNIKARVLSKQPLKSSESLFRYETFEVTPVIGTEFRRGVQIADLLSAPNSDDLIRDLAILISRRGVVFFRAQEISIEQQTELANRLGELSGKPITSKLHIHPTTQEVSELGDYVSSISTENGGINSRDFYKERWDGQRKASSGWHADITFEPVPSDYAILKLHTLPPSGGGDTLWASGYEAYDRLSPALRGFLETLTATHSAPRFKEVARQFGFPLRTNRGAPENIGEDLEAIHPVIRTSPVTGWKTLFVNKGFTTRINELSRDESDNMLAYLFSHISENHDLQVRFRWEKNDVAIWDNRVVYHTATDDYWGNRSGDRVVSLGEKPYFDKESKSRREALLEETRVWERK